MTTARSWRRAARRPAAVATAYSDVVLLVSDGIDGVTAVDLDHRLAGRRVVEGERAGDQPFRLTLTGSHLVVGWGEIYAAPLSGASSTKIDDATIYLPAAEPGEVWTVTWDGGRVGEGQASVRRVRVDGTIGFSSDGFDTARLTPLLGVPGGRRSASTRWGGGVGCQHGHGRSSSRSGTGDRRDQ
ncbi:MAG TPA: hypothetical protein VFH36_20955 [Acidimicrobiales bacterium]|nr:hypothetical protein [Acidimicrobiales bacterium]